MSSWVIYVVESFNSNLEFHFIENGNQVSIKKKAYPLNQGLGAWIGDGGGVPWRPKEEEASPCICPCMKMNNNLIFDQGFKICGLASQIAKDIIEKWIDFHEL